MTGTVLTSVFNWADAKLRAIEYGSVSITFTICDGSITRVDKQVSETDKYQLKPKQG